MTLEKDQRKLWEDLVEEWKELVCQNIHQDFEEFMSGKVVTNTDEEKILKDQFLQRLQMVENRRTETMEAIASLSPPTIDDSLLQMLMENVSKLYDEFSE